MCQTQTNAAQAANRKDFAVGSYVKDEDKDKYKVVGYTSAGEALVEDSDGDVQTFDQDDLDAWTSRDDRRYGEAEVTPVQTAVAVAINRFFNIYEGDRVGSLVKDRYKADSNSRNSRRKRIAVGTVTVNKAANGDFVANVSVTKIA